MTDIPVRERLARAAHDAAFEGKTVGVPWDDLQQFKHDRAIKEHWFRAVDAILAELQEPSRELEAAFEDAPQIPMGERGIAVGDIHHHRFCERWAAALQHIRDGGT